MSSKAKTFLVVLEINNLLFYLNNPRSKAIDPHVSRIPVTYHDTYDNMKVSYRSGKAELLYDLFVQLK